MNLFKTTDKKIFSKLGKKSYIRNGIGYGFISDDYLYDNCLLEIGFGRVTSGRGDWGGGAEYASDSPLKITIDKEFVIKKVDTASFYNSRSSQKIESIAKKIAKKLKVGSKLPLTDIQFKSDVKKILDFLPCKAHIGWDVFEHPHMIEHYLEPNNKDYYRKFRTPTSLKN